jgi:uroporphyrinogen decarboxylase
VSIQQIMPFGAPEDVAAEARRLMRAIGAGGGYILAPSHAIPRDVPVENILALIRCARDEQPG